jgi:hypothetical protein
MKVKYISDLLYWHECVIVPGFGGFLSSYLPAHISGDSNRIFPPSSNLAFNASLVANDGILANHISKESGVSYREAVAMIRGWVEDAFRQLNNGESVVLDEIGVISLNSDGNLQFEPQQKQNYLGNSYGLPSFVAQRVSRKEAESILPRSYAKLQGTSKMRVLIPETLKWAAVLAPFIAFTLWGSLNTEKMGNYLHNYSGLFSWVKSTPGKKSTISLKTAISPSAKVAIEGNITGLHENLPSSYDPAVISYSEMRDLISVKKVEPAENEAKVEITVTDAHYFIIGGAFKEFNNARNLLSELKMKGYPAEIIDTTSKGMYIVCFQGFGSKPEAREALEDIRQAGYVQAWVMHK